MSDHLREKLTKDLALRFIRAAKEIEAEYPELTERDLLAIHVGATLSHLVATVSALMGELHFEAPTVRGGKRE